MGKEIILFNKIENAPMYSRSQLAKKYIQYYFQAANGKGHGIHSPFVFDFVQKILNDNIPYPDYKRIEERRKDLLHDNSSIVIQDFGAGSGVLKSSMRQIKRIAASSLKPKKYGQLLYRMVKYYKPVLVIELGTSFGITTAYLAAGSDAEVYTLEGAESIADIAIASFAKLEINNIELIRGAFEQTLPGVLSKIDPAFFVFIDGNHRKKPTLNYFYQLLNKANELTIMVFDDIHWSGEMEEAWEQIKAEPAVTLTIDLFFIGIVLFRKNFKSKQHFNIRF